MTKRIRRIYILELWSEERDDWVLMRYSYSDHSYSLYKIFQEIWEYEKGIPCRLVIKKELF